MNLVKIFSLYKSLLVGKPCIYLLSLTQNKNISSIYYEKKNEKCQMFVKGKNSLKS